MTSLSALAPRSLRLPHALPPQAIRFPSRHAPRCPSLPPPTPLSCIVDGNKKFRIFSGNFACGIVLENLVVQHALNGVHVGACQFAARRVTFQHNVADKSSTGGAVFNSRDSSPTAGSPLQFTTQLTHPTAGSPLQLTSCFLLNNTALTCLSSLLSFSPISLCPFFLSSSRDSSPTAGTPLQFTTCVFLNNTAAGNGGVINVGRDPTGGPDVKIAKCTFTRGGARGGARGGGAILTTSPILTSIGTRFSANAVMNGRGGAISIQAQGAVVQFCSSNFRRNRAPVYPVSNDMNAGTSDGTVTACGSTGPRRIRKTPALKEVQSCRRNFRRSRAPVYPVSNDMNAGTSDGTVTACGSMGPRRIRKTLNPEGGSELQNQFDPAKACTVCKMGYTLESKCVACSPGFFSGQKGRCTVCGTVDKKGRCTVCGTVDKKGRCTVCGTVDKGRRGAAPCVEPDKVRGSVDKVCGTMDKVCGTVDKVRGSVDKVRGSVDKVRGSVDKVRGSVDKVRGSVDKVRGSVDKVRGSVDKVRGSVDKVRGSVDKVRGSVDKVRGSVDKVGVRDNIAWQKGRCTVCGTVDKGFFSGQKGRCTMCGTVDKVRGRENRASGCENKACEREGQGALRTVCKMGYTMESKCVACAEGFFLRPEGALHRIQELTGELSNLNNATQAASSKRCQQMCQRAQTQTKLYKNYCNLWAFVENR
ncbi:unnamed protein product [Closterium sp. NIES-65]|nr:unnamed protein product [Closterium sp. NIES-65]